MTFLQEFAFTPTMTFAVSIRRLSDSKLWDFSSNQFVTTPTQPLSTPPALVTEDTTYPGLYHLDLSGLGSVDAQFTNGDYAVRLHNAPSGATSFPVMLTVGAYFYVLNGLASGMTQYPVQIDGTRKIAFRNVSSVTQPTVDDCLAGALAQAGGAWTFNTSNNTLTLMNADGSTYRVFNLAPNAASPTSRS